MSNDIVIHILSDVVIEMSKFQGTTDFKTVKANNIHAVLHKSSEGATVQDGKYKDRAKQATDAGLLWGAYHIVASTSTVEDQMTNLLNMTKNDKSEYPLIALAILANKSGILPKLETVEEMVTRVYQETKRYPLIHGKKEVIEKIIGTSDNSTLFNRKLCIVDWQDPSLPLPKPPKGWFDKDILFWQYVENADVPGVASGIGGGCPRTKFNGKIAELKKFWPEFNA